MSVAEALLARATRRGPDHRHRRKLHRRNGRRGDHRGARVVSAVFDRGFVTYSNAAKVEMLGVADDARRSHGAVSEEVAREMAEGALARSAADCRRRGHRHRRPRRVRAQARGPGLLRPRRPGTLRSETMEFGALGRGARAGARHRSRAGPAPGGVVAVELGRPPLEGADDALHRVVEDHADHALQDPVAELEVDLEVHLAAARRPRRGSSSAIPGS